MSNLLENLWTVDFETEAIDGALPPMPVGVAIKPPGKPSYYLAFNHLSDNNCSRDRAVNILEDIFRNHPVLFHNATFDVAVAKYHLGIEFPSKIHDTMLLLFLRDPHAKTLSLKPSAESILNLPPEDRDELYEWILANVSGANKKNAGSYISVAPVRLVSKYACSDTDMTYLLFEKLYPEYRGKAYERECQLLPILTNSTLNGIKLDEKKLSIDYLKYSKVRKIVESKIYKILESTPNLDSGAELAKALNNKYPNMQWDKTSTGKNSISKASLINALKDEYLLNLINYRSILCTYLETFMLNWITKEKKGRLHFNWNQVRNGDSSNILGARTGRLSSTPSMLNVPTRPNFFDPKFGLPFLPIMKSYFLPEEGQIWIENDYSGQELRILAHFEDGMMLEGYQKDPYMDIHQIASDMLTSILGKPVSRFATKMVSFSILYGAGLDKLAEMLSADQSVAAQMECTKEEASLIKTSYLRIMPGIKSVQNSIKYEWDRGLPIHTWGGRAYYKEPSRLVKDKRTGEMRMADFGYKGLNYLIQASASDVTKQAIINYDQVKSRDCSFLLSVHDSIGISGDLKEVKILSEAMRDIKLDCPLIGDCKSGLNYGDLHKLEV